MNNVIEMNVIEKSGTGYILEFDGQKKFFYSVLYCEYCGTKKQPIRDPRGRFYSQTGHPIFLGVCPNRACQDNQPKHHCDFGFLDLKKYCKVCDRYNHGLSGITG